MEKSNTWPFPSDDDSETKTSTKDNAYVEDYSSDDGPGPSKSTSQSHGEQWAAKFYGQDPPERVPYARGYARDSGYDSAYGSSSYGPGYARGGYHGVLNPPFAWPPPPPPPPVEGQLYREAPKRDPQSSFWDQLRQFDEVDSGAQQKSLVSARGPWNPSAPRTGQPHLPDPKRLESLPPGADGPSGSVKPEPSPHKDPPHSDARPSAPENLRRPFSGDDGRTKQGEDERFVQRDDVDPDDQAPTQPPPRPKRAQKRKHRRHEPRGRVRVGAREDYEAASHDVAPIRIDLAHDPSQAPKDMSIRLELEVEEDWEEDLEEFCRLRRLGLISEAKEHFRSTLEHVSANIPYIRVQYAEMLLSCGDYKGFQSFFFATDYLPRPPEETEEDRDRGKLFANYALLKLFSQRPLHDFPNTAWRVVCNTLKALATETTMGSTEIQLLSLCLRALHRIEICTNDRVVEQAKRHVRRLFDWRQLYLDLVSEGSIWDFKDLFLAAVACFGWGRAVVQFFDTIHFSQALDCILEDWSQPFYDEASVMGLLDLFTSLILQNACGRTPESLLIQQAKALAETVEKNGPELMRSRPFIQWLLAKSLVELEAPPARPDGVRLEDFGGLLLKQEDYGQLRLPIYVPTRHAKRPDWDLFFSRSTPAQRRVVEVAARAAEQIGDYDLQAEAMKLLILQSQDPRPWMNALGRLQLEIQGDKEGYLATCLSKYLVATDPAQEAALLTELERPAADGEGLYFEDCENGCLDWAWIILRILLKSSNEDDGPTGSGEEAPSPFHRGGFSLDGSRLPAYIVDFSREELEVSVGPPMEPLPCDDLEQRRDYEDEEYVDDKGQLDPALRERLDRRTASRRPRPRDTSPWDPARFGTWDWRHNYPGAPYPGGLYPGAPFPGGPFAVVPYAGATYPGSYPPGPPPYYGQQPLAPPQIPWPARDGHQPDTVGAGTTTPWDQTTLVTRGWTRNEPGVPYTPNPPQLEAHDGQQRPAIAPSPWAFYEGEDPDPLAQGINPSISVEGWPKNWYEDAQRGYAHTIHSDPEAGSGDIDRSPSEESSSDEVRWELDSDGLSRTLVVDHRPAKGKSNSADKDRRRTTILKEIDTYSDGYSSTDSNTPRQDDLDQKPHVIVEDGVTKLDIPNTMLGDNGVTVLLTNQKDAHRPRAFVVSKSGVFETIALERTRGRPHRDDKSEFSIRTKSVKFDAASSSSERSTSSDETVKQGRSAVAGSGDGSTARKKDKGKEIREPKSRPPPVASVSDADEPQPLKGKEKDEGKEIREPRSRPPPVASVSDADEPQPLKGEETQKWYPPAPDVESESESPQREEEGPNSQPTETTSPSAPSEAQARSPVVTITQSDGAESDPWGFYTGKKKKKTRKSIPLWELEPEPAPEPLPWEPESLPGAVGSGGGVPEGAGAKEAGGADDGNDGGDGDPFNLREVLSKPVRRGTDSVSLGGTTLVEGGGGRSLHRGEWGGVKHTKKEGVEGGDDGAGAGEKRAMKGMQEIGPVDDDGPLPLAPSPPPVEELVGFGVHPGPGKPHMRSSEEAEASGRGKRVEMQEVEVSSVTG